MTDSKTLPPISLDSTSEWHISPATDHTLDLGVDPTKIGFHVYSDVPSAASLISWKFLTSKESFYAIVTEIANKKYFWQCNTEDNKVYCKETTGSESSIVKDDRNLFAKVNGQSPYSFMPKVSPQKYVQFESTVYLTLVDHQTLATNYYIFKLDQTQAIV